jgi:hypothetical protein
VFYLACLVLGFLAQVAAGIVVFIYLSGLGLLGVAYLAQLHRAAGVEAASGGQGQGLGMSPSNICSSSSLWGSGLGTAESRNLV